MLTFPEQFSGRFARKLSRALTVAVSALVLAALPVAAQDSSAGADSGIGNPGSGSAAGMPGTMSGTVTGAKLAREDISLMNNLAQLNIAAIEAGRLALEKSRSDQVRNFAQQMLDQHTAALQQLQTLAQTKGITLPDETDLQHKSRAMALRILSGNTFDSQYLKRVGISVHLRTIELLQQAQDSATDPDLKAMASQMLPPVQGHLRMARHISVQMGSTPSTSQ